MRPLEAQAAESSPYLVGPILRACALLKCFRFDGESIPLREIVARTGMNKTTAFRAARTLVAGGLLDQVAGDRYRSAVSACRAHAFRIGYAAMSTRSLFARAVSDSLRVAAAKASIELIEVDNDLSPRVALRKCAELVRQRVDLAIEFQVRQEAAAAIASSFAEAGIPLIAVHTPHPGATFFGGNNYVAGRMAGRALGRFAVRCWDRNVDHLLLLGHSAAGPLTESRSTGAAVGLTDVLPGFDSNSVIQLDCHGGYVETMEVVLKFLARSRAKRILAAAINDAVGLGALRAFTEAGRPDHCAIVSQNGTIAARAELRRRDSRLIGAVAYFPEQYGDHLLTLALDILRKRVTPPAVFTKHVLMTAQNVDDYYPNDLLGALPDANSLLFERYH